MRNKEWSKVRAPYEFSDRTKLEALYRDGWACASCGTKKEDTEDGYLEIHHILEIWFVVKYLPTIAPSVVASLDNALCLCTDCHNKEHAKEKSTNELLAVAQGLIAIAEGKEKQRRELAEVMRNKRPRRLPVSA